VAFKAIAAGLNEQRIPTARGGSAWTATQVDRTLERDRGPFRRHGRVKRGKA
jgi:hypothetical protein